MRKLKTLLGVIALTFALTSFSKMSQSFTPLVEDWELSMKDGLIQFEYLDSFANKKKELCTYYMNTTNIYNINSKISNELSGKGGKLLSNTSFTATVGLFGADGNHFATCSADKNDTLMGSLSITINKSSMKLSGVKSTFNSIKCKFKVILVGKNKLVLKFRGFTVTDSKVNAMKGTVQTTETDLEVVYNEFLKADKKKKSETDFFKDLRMVVDVCHDAIVSQLQKDIKTNELD